MKISYDPEVDAMRITFQKGDYSISTEAAEGIIVDTAKDGSILAIEILDVSERMPTNNLKNVELTVVQ